MAKLRSARDAECQLIAFCGLVGVIRGVGQLSGLSGDSRAAQIALWSIVIL
jgi:hypothetical protein